MTFAPSTSTEEYVILPLQLEGKQAVRQSWAWHGLVPFSPAQTLPAHPGRAQGAAPSAGPGQEQLEATAGLGGRRHRAPSPGCLLKGAWATTATGSRALTPSPEQ